MKTWGLVILAMATVAVTAQPAQSQTRFGPQVAWADDFDLGVGGRLDFGLGNLFGVDDGPFQNLFGSTTATYFFTDCGFSEIDCSYIEFEGNLGVPFTLDGASIQPFAGAGLHVGRFSVDDDFDTPFGSFSSSSTEVGLNLLGGIFFPLGDLSGFAQGKIELAGGEQFIISAGVLF